MFVFENMQVCWEADASGAWVEVTRVKVGKDKIFYVPSAKMSKILARAEKDLLDAKIINREWDRVVREFGPLH